MFTHPIFQLIQHTSVSIDLTHICFQHIWFQHIHFQIVLWFVTDRMNATRHTHFIFFGAVYVTVTKKTTACVAGDTYIPARPADQPTNLSGE